MASDECCWPLKNWLLKFNYVSHLNLSDI